MTDHHEHNHECGCGCGHHHDENLPDVEGHNGFEIEFKAHYKVECQKVWQALTDSEQIKAWFPELKVTEVKEGNEVQYQDEDETLSFLILDVEAPYLLSYQWKQMIVGFELDEEEGQTELTFKEWIEEVSDEVIADLTQWAVRLEALRYYLEEDHVPNLDDLYKETYPEIKAMF
ncbi:SRPBCC domain-containing protein [Dolosicoccus paucivorans]